MGSKELDPGSAKGLSALLIEAERHRISDLCTELKTDLQQLLTVLDPKRQTQRYGHVKLRFGFSPDYEFIYLWSEREERAK